MFHKMAKRRPFIICQSIMKDNVSEYFQASKELTAKLSEVRRLKQHTAPAMDVHLLDVQIRRATARVEEHLEMFTWETQDTDLIRSAFLAIAKNTLKNIAILRPISVDNEAVQPPSDEGASLINNIDDALRKALSSKGRYVPRIEIPQGLAIWCYQVVEEYLTSMHRQLYGATFDNLLEAVTYFEKSTLSLRTHYETLAKTNSY